jgi:hypothetical protein
MRHYRNTSSYLFDIQRDLNFRHIGSYIALQRGYINWLSHVSCHLGRCWDIV